MKLAPLALATLASVSLSLLPSFASAHKAGDFILRAGAATVDPSEDSGSVFVGGSDTGMEVGADSNTQLGLTFTYMLADHWGIGLLAATPFEHTLSLKKSVLGLGDGTLADMKHLPPTVTLQYYFNKPASAFQPYVGAGINYTTFFDEEFSSTRKNQGFSSLDLDDSWGWAAEVGVDYQINDKWVVNGTLWYLDIDTTAEFRFGGSKSKVDVDIDPWVYMLGVGYKF
ncbi:OmpW family outer membrane protein [Zooshikella ganghwensis]|uniref:Outer membrane protein W n=1 Tax=Zooshikella ganghwensis TaxID=202772 RepID=A0A4P9VHR7_9GAMM|nr:OmpW family outer membrane protein [Zooshikella ganghwensis]RDH42728.1 outer membrane protein OmpW [Zooshikella ganghwensis]